MVHDVPANLPSLTVTQYMCKSYKSLSPSKVENNQLIFLLKSLSPNISKKSNIQENSNLTKQIVRFQTFRKSTQKVDNKVNEHWFACPCPAEHSSVWSI